MTGISGFDRDVLALWREHGIPDDRSTLEYAAQLALRLADTIDELETTVHDLCARSPHCIPRETCDQSPGQANMLALFDSEAAS